MTKSQLFEAKDNDMLLSMPIPPRMILGSRMIILMAFNYLFELLVAVPAVIMWVRAAEITAFQIICFVLVFITLPCLAMAVSGLFGWVLAMLTGRARNKSLMTVLFSVVFLVLYFMFFGRLNTYIQELALNGTVVANSFGAVAPLFWIGNAIAQPNALHLVLSLLLMLIPFLLMYYILSATFIKVATSKRGAAKIKYEAKEMRSRSQSNALLGRELKRFLASPVYILNSGLGAIFTVIGAVVLVVKKQAAITLISQMGFNNEMVSLVIILALCMLATLVLITAPSVSLEGKTLWIIKSLPVSSKDILGAKQKLHIYLTLPGILLAALAAVYVFKPSFEYVILMLIGPIMFVEFTANVGLICNLKNVNLDWINETQVIKQGMAVMLSMLLNFLIIGIPAILYFVILNDFVNPFVFSVLFTLCLAVGWWLTQNWISKKGTVIFDEL